MIDFWSLTNADLQRALDIQEGKITVPLDDPMHVFTHDLVLDHLLWLWQRSGKDVIAMKLTYYDRLNAMTPTSKRIHGHA